MNWRYLSDDGKVKLIGNIYRKHLQYNLPLHICCKSAGIPFTSLPRYTALVRKIIKNSPEVAKGIMPDVMELIMTKYPNA